MSTLITVLVTLAMALGGGGGVVFAAQNNLPTGLLYPVKLASEDVRLSVTSDPAARTSLLLDFTQRRVEELAALRADSSSSLQPVADRLRAEMDAALQAAASTDDATLSQMLRQMQGAIDTQLTIVMQAQTGASTQAGGVLVRAQAMLQERQQLVQLGLTQPQKFRAEATMLPSTGIDVTPPPGPIPTLMPGPTGMITMAAPMSTPMARPTDMITMPARRPTVMPRPTVMLTMPPPRPQPMATSMPQPAGGMHPPTHMPSRKP